VLQWFWSYAAAQPVLPPPQTLAVPPPPHVAGAVHVPHELTVRVVPQLSAAVMVPQPAPTPAQSAASVSGTHVTVPLVEIVVEPSVGSTLTIQLLPPLFSTCKDCPPCEAVSVEEGSLILTLTTV
jgi:hypothetical protein